MPATTGNGYPYPLPTEPVAQGAAAIKALAEALPPKLVQQRSPSAGTNVSTSASTGAFFLTFPTPFKAGTIPHMYISALSPNSGGFNFQLDSSGISGGIDHTRVRYIARRYDGTPQLDTTIAIQWSAIGVAA